MKERMITTFEGIILNSKFGKTACVNPLQLAENGDYFYAHVQLAFEVYQAALSANHIGDADKMDDHIPDGGNMVQQKATPCGQVSITETGKHTCETLRIGDEKICPDCSPCRGLLAHLQKHELSSNPLQLPAKEQNALAEMEARKDAAYLERNQVVAALAKCFPSGIAKTAIEGWSEDWHRCVYIDLPTGQASWHYHDSQAYLFADLPPYKGTWDGHTTVEKYARIAMLQPAQEPVKQESKWISVEDRLPEKDVFVDVLLRSRDNPNYEKRVADVSFISGEFKVQTFFDHEYVSHWMPLPLPPVKEVSDGR